MNYTSDVDDRVEYASAEEDDALFTETDHQLDLFRIIVIIEDVLLIHCRYILSVCCDVSTSCTLVCRLTLYHMYLLSIFLAAPIIP